MSDTIHLFELRKTADQCVKCAVCLPHCPTYALKPEEAESPRGRITLLQGIVYERLELTSDVEKHLNNCLSCGRCEQVCPAQVPYTRLLDGTRAYLQEQSSRSPVPPLRKVAAWLLASPRALKWTAFFSRLAQRLPAANKLGNTSSANRFTRALSWIPPRVNRSAQPSMGLPVSTVDRAEENTAKDQSQQREAWLFTGCLTDAFEQDLATSARRLAAAYGVKLTQTSGLCCGALYQHSGNRQQAERLSTLAIETLASSNAPIVVLPSGCARGLIDGMNTSCHPQAEPTRSRITNLFSLIEHTSTEIAYSNNQDVVGVYMPCSTDKNAAASLSRVVARALATEPTLIGRGHGCCGAAGDHMLIQPKKADRMAAVLVDEIIVLGLTHVLVPNAGCAWHLRANLAQRGVQATVEHPVAWLERNLEAPN